jgi:hypothetical protein
VEEEKWLTEIEQSWRLELDELKRRRALEAVDDRTRSNEMELMRQADEEKQWTDMEARIARAKVQASQEHGHRMEEKRLQQVRLLEEEKERNRLASLKAEHERNRSIDREVKKTMSRMLDILMEVYTLTCCRGHLSIHFMWLTLVYRHRVKVLKMTNVSVKLKPKQKQWNEA